MKRREYNAHVVINGRLIRKVVIDRHYELKHSGSINDGIILELVNCLASEMFSEVERKKPYSYFKTGKIELKGKFYKLVWLLEDNEAYIGIINAYRRG